ncbi:MAG: hypothetical protein WCQ00_00790 [bacterium]
MFLKKQLKFRSKKHDMTSCTSHTNLNRGFSLAEILIGSSIICLSLILIINLETGISKLGFGSTQRVQAGMLAEEGVTAINSMRNASWQNIGVLSNNTLYGLYWNQSNKNWQATTTISLVDNKFTRTVVFTPINRDIASFNIVDSGGVPDTDTRGYVVSVSWQENGATSTRSLTSYIHNIYNK